MARSIVQAIDSLARQPDIAYFPSKSIVQAIDRLARRAGIVNPPSRSVVQAIDRLAYGPGVGGKASKSVVEALDKLTDGFKGISIYPSGALPASSLSPPTNTTPGTTPTISTPVVSPVIPTPDVSSTTTPTTPPAKESKRAVSPARTAKPVPKRKRKHKR